MESSKQYEVAVTWLQQTDKPAEQLQHAVVTEKLDSSISIK